MERKRGHVTELQIAWDNETEVSAILQCAIMLCEIALCDNNPCEINF